jgi:hypothetical protein
MDSNIVYEDSEYRYFAVKNLGRIEIIECDEGNLYGTVPIDATPADIQRVMNFYFIGFAAGREAGKFEVQTEIKKSLGL